MFEKLKLKYKIAKMTVEQYTNMLEAKLGTDEKATSPVTALVMLMVIAVLAGALIPIGIDALTSGKNASGSWSASETATYSIISILVLIAVVLLLVRIATGE